MKKIRTYFKGVFYSLLALFCLMPQQRAGTTADKSLLMQIHLSAPAADDNLRLAGNAAWFNKSSAPRPLAAAPSLTKYIQEKFSAPEITEAFRHSDATELEKTVAGIKLKTGYLGSSKPQSALKPEEIKALEAMAARDNFKEDGLPVFTLGNNLSAGYTIKYNGNVLKVRHVLESGKPSEAVIQGGAVVYPDAHRDTNILYVMSPGRCQEILLLKSEKAPKQFEYEYSKEVGLNEKGEIIVDGLTLSRPVIFDASGRRVNGFYRKISKKRVLLTFNAVGLHYPLLIDPTWQASAGSMNAARRSHTATLLPNGKVLVAGGTNGSGCLFSTELYDPSAGTFSATGSMGAARYHHTATLLPNGKVLMAGGWTGSTALSSAELYDPTAGTFSATGSMSTMRYAHTSTLLPNGKVLVVGGEGGGTSLSSAELYDPSAGTFSATGALALGGRGWYTATLLPNGKVLVAGGENGGVSLFSAELYDPSAGTFVTTGSMGAARQHHTITLLPNGKVLVAGGYYNGIALSSAELYDPSAGTFSATGSMGTARWYHAATLLSNGKVLVTGGGSGSTALSSAELYDPSAGTFSATGSMSAARYSHTATLLPNGNVLVAGGYNSVSLSSAELYVLSGGSGTFSTTGSMSAARRDHTATLLPNGKVLVAGGDNGSGWFSSAELYDPSAGTFSATGSMSATRVWHTATLLSNGKVLVAGGYGDRASAELYDPTAGTFSATGSMSVARYYHTATLLPNGKVFVFGGYNGSGYLSSAELYDPTAGTFSATGSMSAARELPTATLLPNGIVLVSGGGNGSSAPLSSAELYNPSAGTFSATGSMSAARAVHTATLLPNGKVLVTGGWDGSGPSSSAELYDPSAGTFSATGAMSAAREYHTATLLPNGKVLVAGGWVGSGPGSSAELYDPSAGTFSATGSMSVARFEHTAILLPNGKVLMSSGFNNIITLSSVELYDTAFGLVPATTLTSVTPNPATGSNSAQTLTLNGSDFVSDAKVTLRDVTYGATYSNITTTFVNSTQLTISVTLGNDPGNWTAQVINPDTTSSGQTAFSVNAPVPVISSLSPSSAQAGGAGFTLTVNGTTFTSASSVRWNGSGRTTTVTKSAGGLVISLQASISASDIASAGTAQVTVFNPGPGGGTSSATAFTIPLSAGTIVIQPGPEGKDTCFGTVYVTGGTPDAQNLYDGGWADAYYDFFEFDITAGPSATDTVKAEFMVYANIAPNDPGFQVMRITASWTESGVTLSNNPASVFYKNFGTVVQGWNTVDITELYKNWKSGTWNNYGIKLSPTYNNNTNGNIYSSDSTDASLRPKLVIASAAAPLTPTISRSPSIMSFTGQQGGSNPANQSLSVSNSGGGTLSWSVSDDTSWLSLSPASGSSTGETDSVTVSVNTVGLSTGTYNGTITISATGATNTPQTTSVTLTVTAVTSLDAWDPADDIASNGTQITPTTVEQSHGPHTLSGTDLADWDQISMTAGYIYYFDTIGGAGDNYGELYSDSAGKNIVAYNDDSGGNGQFSFNYTAATTQTYYLKIRAYASGGSWSGSLKYRYAAPAGTPTISRSPSSMSFTKQQGGSNPANQTLTISNSGGGTLSWSVGGDASWLSLSPASGSSTGEMDAVTVSVNTTGLTVGTYNATVIISASGATNTPQALPVTLTVATSLDDWDPADDTVSNGTQITPATSEQSHGPHTLGGTDLADWYRISMTAGYTYYFDTIGGAGDNYGELCDSAGTNIVAYNDDSGGNGQFSFNYTAATTQIYYLKIRAYISGDNWSGSLKYRDVTEIPRQGNNKTTLGDNLFNPRAGGTSKIKFNLPAAGQVSLKIYDLSGKLIRTLFEGAANAGATQKDWDGKDDSGRYVVPSVYFLHYVYPGGKEVRKIGVKK